MVSSRLSLSITASLLLICQLSSEKGQVV
jgi:hypothetical protein